MLPAAREYAVSARAAILDHAASLPFENADTLLRELIALDPAHARVSDLIALRARIADLDGIAAPPVDMAALGISDLEVYEAKIGCNLIDRGGSAHPSPLRPTKRWRHRRSPPRHRPGPIRRRMARNQTGGLRPVRLASVRRSSSPNCTTALNCSGACAFYCIAEIESPDARAVTFAHGSAGPSRVWVNGVEAFSTSSSGIALID